MLILLQHHQAGAAPHGLAQPDAHGRARAGAHEREGGRAPVPHPGCRACERFPGLKVWGHKDLILMQCMNTIMRDDQDHFVWWSLIHGLETIRARKDF